jgi:X-Pro dipeptidyl-peptidase
LTGPGFVLWAGELKVPIVEDGQTQVIPEFKDRDLWIRQDLWVETTFDSDGDGRPDRMHVDVTRPRQTDTRAVKLPVILHCSPYFGGTGSAKPPYLWDVRHALGAVPPPRQRFDPIERRDTRPIISKSYVNDWVPHGYAVAHASSPGTGFSQGCPTIGKDNETLAIKAVIDWLNGRAPGYTTPDGNEAVLAEWSTGKVGMTGVSHPGTFALAGATTGVDGLEVVIPVAANTSIYHYYRSNGLIRHPYGFLGEDIDLMYDFVHSNPDRCDWCDRHVRDTEMAQGFDRIRGDYNAFWAERDYLHDLGPVQAAVLMAHGLNDWNVVPEHTHRIYQALKTQGVTAQVYYHQGGHGGSPPKDMMNRWFARYLHGVPNEVEKGPRAWIVRENDDRSQPTAYEDHPHPAAAPVKLHLIAGAPERGQLVTEVPAGQGRETLVDNVSFSGAALAQEHWTEHRLLYVTPSLTEPVHMSGVPRISVTLASSKPAANLSVWLVSLPWNDKPKANITDNIITRGWADPQNYRSLTESEPLVPGRFYELCFDLQPDDQIIAEGQQIGLMIFSSDKDFTLWPDPGTELTIDLDATHLVLPVVGGPDAFSKAVAK